jgi:dihydrofolate synthase / folylpolyglutamate synthase
VRSGLPFPGLRGEYQLRNAACALALLAVIADTFPLGQAQIKTGLMLAAAPGRFQVLPGLPVQVLDVAHNPDAAQALAGTLKRQFVKGTTRAVFGIMKDKDVAGVIQAMKNAIDEWHVATLDTPRAAAAEDIAAALHAAGISNVRLHADVRAAYEVVRASTGKDDRIVVFGSFHTVGDILARDG